MGKNLFSVARSKSTQKFRKLRIFLILLNVTLFAGSVITSIFGMSTSFPPDPQSSADYAWLGIVSFALIVLFILSMITTVFIRIKYSTKRIN